MPTVQSFSINEESDAGGVSYCWTEKKKGGFYLYGNELGKMAGPEPTVYDAVTASGFQFGMDNAEIDCSLSFEELQQILSSASFILSNISYLVINGREIEGRDPEGIIKEYRSSLDEDFGWTE
ncbi:hypothetical protein E0493_21560 [Roseomonas sp. M0104]|uniref:Uncharacterized protein n=1 Tax=Teichococcus coralli TaxID=2545983 RepID=A0A845BGA9_9PROT|nr:hypothetical protein [Pseudoroseomonas coralli]MXP65938.1 hypothetical protein [Pseudoroseomonas coralli]